MKTNEGKLGLLLMPSFELRMSEEYLFEDDILEVKTENSIFERRENGKKYRVILAFKEQFYI